MDDAEFSAAVAALPGAKVQRVGEMSVLKERKMFGQH